MDKPTTLRLPKDVLRRIKKMSESEYLDTSSAMRRLIIKALKEWELDYAVERYKKGEFSFGQVAKFTGISVWEVPALLKEKKVPFNYDEEELEAENEAIKWLKKKR
jgi:predicted HTH domain antitoxin